LSEYGRKRIEYEKLHGPAELTEKNASDSIRNNKQRNSTIIKNDDDASTEEEADNDDEMFDEEGKSFDLNKLRKYQFNRLKYYYAIVECDTKRTSECIYNECDGMEYESSCNRLDLRFVPDEESFSNQEPTQVCTEAPDLLTYRPNLFITTALNQTKVDCTWDETPRDRLALTMKNYTEDEIKSSNFKNILAMSSEDEDEVDEASKKVQKKSDNRLKNINAKSNKLKKKDTNKDGSADEEDIKIRNYKELLLGEGITKKNTSQERLEFSWDGGVIDEAESGEGGSEDGYNELLFNKKSR
jgi:hypothetical protein